MIYPEIEEKKKLNHRNKRKTLKQRWLWCSCSINCNKHPMRLCIGKKLVIYRTKIEILISCVHINPSYWFSYSMTNIVYSCCNHSTTIADPIGIPTNFLSPSKNTSFFETGGGFQNGYTTGMLRKWNVPLKLNLARILEMINTEVGLSSRTKIERLSIIGQCVPRGSKEGLPMFVIDVPSSFGVRPSPWVRDRHYIANKVRKGQELKE